MSEVVARPLFRSLVVLEAVICFALPAYTLVWGLLTLPLWVGVVQRGGHYAIEHLISIVGGTVGAVGLIKALRFYASSDQAKRFRAASTLVLAVIGLVALWIPFRGEVRTLELNPGVLLFALLPTLCAVHLVVLCYRRERRRRDLGVPNNTMQATCENACA